MGTGLHSSSHPDANGENKEPEREATASRRIPEVRVTGVMQTGVEDGAGLHQDAEIEAAALSA